MIPCKENKCILLPLCKNRIDINCTPLRSYFRLEYMKTMEYPPDYGHKAWDKILDVLPKVGWIKAPGYITMYKPQYWNT